MQNEKPNNNIGWKEKLEELENPEVNVFNKEASWNKLHERLQSKKNKKKAVLWYWLAAACLLFALFISFFLSNKKENVLVKNNLSGKQVNPSSSQVPVINNDTQKFNSSSSMKNQPLIHFNNDNPKIIATVNHKKIPAKVVELKEENAVTEKIKNMAVMPVDTAISIAANLPEKKKLKVVHVNELGEPIVEAPNVARVYERHTFQFKLMNQEGYTSSSLPSNNKVLKIFIARNVPSN